MACLVLFVGVPFVVCLCVVVVIVEFVLLLLCLSVLMWFTFNLS